MEALLLCRGYSIEYPKNITSSLPTLHCFFPLTPFSSALLSTSIVFGACCAMLLQNEGSSNALVHSLRKTQKSWMSPNRIACKDRHSLSVRRQPEPVPCSDLLTDFSDSDLPERLEGGNRFRALCAVQLSARVVEVKTRVQGGEAIPRGASMQRQRPLDSCGLHPASQNAAESPPHGRFLIHKRNTLILARLLK